MKKTHYKLEAILLMSCVLVSCGTVHVRVKHFLPSQSEEADQRGNYRNVYVLLKKPSSKKKLTGLVGSIVKHVVEKKIEEHLGDDQIWNFKDRVEISLLAQKVGNALAKAGLDVAAYRVILDESEDAFIRDIQPSHVLHIQIESLVVGRSKKDKREVIEKDGKRQVKVIQIWEFNAVLVYQVRLESYPDDQLMDSFSETVKFSEQKSNKISADRWYRKIEGKLLERTAKKLAKHFGFKSVIRYRSLFQKENDSESAEALLAARQKKWHRSVKIWEKRIASGNGHWTDEYGLGLASERRREYGSALEHYERARVQSREVNEGGKVRWEDILKEVSLVRSAWGDATQKRAAWFDRRVAVLPFSEETNSIEGPEWIRQLTHEMLASGGYAVIPLKEVDSILRRQGFSDGGQLKLVKPKKVAQWLEADRLVFGHVEEFKEVMVGIYNKRVVSGKTTLWNRESQSEEWSHHEKVLREEATSNLKEAGFRLGMQLTRGLWERLRKKPLGWEALTYVRRSLESLPMRPNFKKF